MPARTLPVPRRARDGRARRGLPVNIGGHLIEDSGSGLTKVFEHVGKELLHGEVSARCRSGTTSTRWGSIRDRYAGHKSELKKVIKALVATP